LRTNAFYYDKSGTRFLLTSSPDHQMNASRTSRPAGSGSLLTLVPTQARLLFAGKVPGTAAELPQESAPAEILGERTGNRGFDRTLMRRGDMPGLISRSPLVRLS
jgi:hypothetical protein